MMVMSVACGGNHSACLSTSNNVYTWGCGTYGQLGQGIDVESSFEPLLLHKLSGKEICAVGKRERDSMQVACGQNHSLFLSTNGSVYACGNGYYGQLGLDKENDYVWVREKWRIVLPRRYQSAASLHDHPNRLRRNLLAVSLQQKRADRLRNAGTQRERLRRTSR